MSEYFAIAAEARETTGKSSARKARNEGKIPAVIYGSKAGKNQTITIPAKEVTKRVQQGNFYTQQCEIALGDKKIKVIPKDLAFHPVTDNVEHVDFYQLNDKEKVKIKARIKFINEENCVGVKKGGVINITARRVELLCFPKDIISEIEVDMLNLEIGASIHVSDLNLGENVESAVKSYNPTIATIVGRASDEESSRPSSGGEAEDSEEETEESES